MTDERKPPRAQSQTERDLEGLEARALRETRAGAFGNPIYQGEEPGFTPVQGVLRSFDDPELQRLIVAVWAHTANQEQRYRSLIADSDPAAVRAEVNAHGDALVELRGIDGKNGKVGVLRGDVDKLMSRAWWLITVAIGGIVGAAAKLIFVGATYGALQEQTTNTAARVQLIEQVVFLRSQSQPATVPEKAHVP